MNEQRIREIANQSSTYAENTVSYYSGTDDGLTWEAKILKVRDLKFAELIVKECANHCDLLLDHKISSEWSRGTHDCSRAIKKHFGVEE
jgi:hypothetical protein